MKRKEDYIWSENTIDQQLLGIKGVAEKSIRCFVSNGDENPLDAERWVIANIKSVIQHTAGSGKTYTEISSGNHYGYAINVDDVLEYFYECFEKEVAETERSFKSFFGYLFEITRDCSGEFYINNLEAKYEKLKNRQLTSSCF